jgi:O-antigen/teichoic acid export membrane protein
MNRPLGSKLILLLGLILLGLFIVAPWQRPCQVRNDPGQPLICGRTFAWEGSDVGLYAMALVAILLFWELLPVFVSRFSMRGWPTAIITAALSALIVLCTLIKLIKDNEFQTGWAWVALGVAVAILVIACLRVRWRWTHRGQAKKPEPQPPPRVEAPPAGGPGT